MEKPVLSTKVQVDNFYFCVGNPMVLFVVPSVTRSNLHKFCVDSRGRDEKSPRLL